MSTLVALSSQSISFGCVVSALIELRRTNKRTLITAIEMYVEVKVRVCFAHLLLHLDVDSTNEGLWNYLSVLPSNVLSDHYK